MPAPILLADRRPQRTPSAAPAPGLARLLADNACLAPHVGAGRRASPSARSVLPSVAALALALVQTVAFPAPTAGLLTVALVGIAAWRCAATLAGPPAWAGPTPVNDNPPRPRPPALHG